MSPETSKIKIFISHRHDDKQIADVINNNLQLWGISKNSIYQSSAAGGGGPTFGEDLNENLRNALDEAEVVFLVYTFNDWDWSYCMYECGLGTNPKKPNTRIIIFQTTKDIPEVLKNQIRVNITPENIYRFTEQFHKLENFFRDQEAFAPDISSNILQQRSQTFYEDLLKVIPKHPREPRNRWDFVILKLNVDSLTKIEQEQNKDNKLNIIQEESEIISYFGDATKHFGYDFFPTPAFFKELIIRWKNSDGEERQEWIQELFEEMLRGINYAPAKPTWELMKSKHWENFWMYPVVNHVTVNSDDSMEFEIYIYRLPGSLPNHIPLDS